MRTTERAAEVAQEDALRESGATFPADEIVWGVAVRPGFDELDDPFYHRGLTQHAFLEGYDNVALCGFRPPLSGPRHRRRARLTLPSEGVNPMCGSCARRVVAPRSRVVVPVQPGRPAVAVPVAGATVGAPALTVPATPASPRTVTATVAPRALARGDAAPAASQPSEPIHGPFANEALMRPEGPGTPQAAAGPGVADPGAGGPGVGQRRNGSLTAWLRRASSAPDGVAARGGLLRRGIRPDLGD